jgi:hypothetical protein
MILRNEGRRRYTKIDNGILGDKRLTFKARGILAYLLSKPDNWVVNERDLNQQSPEGVTAMRSGLKELEEFGYLYRHRVNVKETGKLDWEVFIYESPEENPHFTLKPCSGYPCMGNPCVDNPCAVNRTLITNRETTTDGITTERNNNTNTTYKSVGDGASPVASAISEDVGVVVSDTDNFEIPYPDDPTSPESPVSDSQVSCSAPPPPVQTPDAPYLPVSATEDVLRSLPYNRVVEWANHHFPRETYGDIWSQLDEQVRRQNITDHTAYAKQFVFNRLGDFRIAHAARTSAPIPNTERPTPAAERIGPAYHQRAHLDLIEDPVITWRRQKEQQRAAGAKLRAEGRVPSFDRLRQMVVQGEQGADNAA